MQARSCLGKLVGSREGRRACAEGRLRTLALNLRPVRQGLAAYVGRARAKHPGQDLLRANERRCTPATHIRQNKYAYKYLRHNRYTGMPWCFQPGTGRSRRRRRARRTCTAARAAPAGGARPHAGPLGSQTPSHLMLERNKSAICFSLYPGIFPGYSALAHWKR